MKKLFVGNLPYQASEAELQDWFTQAGFQADSVQIIRDKFTGEPRGFGFAEFSNDEEADRCGELGAAIEDLLEGVEHEQEGLSNAREHIRQLRDAFLAD